MATIRIKNILETDIMGLNVALEDNRKILVLHLIAFDNSVKIIKTKIDGYGIRIELNGELDKYVGSNCTVINGDVHKATSSESIMNQGKIGKSNTKIILNEDIDTNKYYKGAHRFEMVASKYHKMHVLHINGKLNYLCNSRNILTTLNGSIKDVFFTGDLYTKGIIVEANASKVYSTKK